MMKTVSAVPSASQMASEALISPCSTSALNASGGPYAEDDSPSAPSPTHAKIATREMPWNVF